MKKTIIYFIFFCLCFIVCCGNKNKNLVQVITTDSTQQSTVDTNKIQQMDSSTVNWNGTYNEKSGGTLVISNYKGNNGFDFALTVIANSDDFCEGSVNGHVVLTNSKEAHFDNKNKEQVCLLTFIFNDDGTIKINEEDCSYFHGAICSFDGTYKKQ